MAHTLTVYRDGTRLEESPPFERVSDLLKDPSLVIWVDVADADEADMMGLQEEFSLPALAVEDAIEAHQRPKLDRYDDHVFGVAYAAKLENGSLGLHEVGMFIAHSYLITVRHERDGAEVQRLRLRCDTEPNLVKTGGGYLAYVLLDEIVDGYFETVNTLQDRLGILEDRLLSDDADESVMPQTYGLRRDIINMRRVVEPLRDVLSAVQRTDRAQLAAGLEDYYRDLYDHVVRVYEELDIAREVLSAAQEGHLSAVSNRLNKVVLRVSSWAAIIAVPTFIASVYGMNFRHMPELGSPFGYPICLAAMAAIAAALFTIFKRSGWL